MLKKDKRKFFFVSKEWKRHGKIGERIGCGFVHESKNDEKRMKRIWKQELLLGRKLK